VKRTYALQGHGGLALLCAGVLCIAIWRSATLSVTCDEACTYNWFLVVPGSFFNYDANNHLLNTLLIKGVLAVLPATAFALRLPALFGAALFLASLFALMKRLNPGSIGSLLAGGVILLNPLILDFLSLARGYGPALGLLFAGMACVTAAIAGERRGEPGGRAWLAASLCLALCVAASLSFLFVAAGLAVTAVSLCLAASGEWRPKVLKLSTWFLIPGALTAVLIHIPIFGQLHLGKFYVGHSSAAGTLLELWRASFQRGSSAVIALRQDPPGGAPWLGTGLTVLLVLFLLVAGRHLAVEFGALRRRGEGCTEGVCITLLAAGALVVNALCFSVAHAAVGLNYPPDRAALYVIPLGVLALAGMALSIRGNAKAPGVIAGLVALALIGAYLGTMELSYFRSWRYDAGSRRIFDRIIAVSGHRPPDQVKVGGTWWYDASMTFYRLTHGPPGMAPFMERGHDPADCDYFIAHPLDLPKLPPAFGKLYEDPVSGAELYGK